MKECRLQNAPPSVFYIPNFISELDEKFLIEKVNTVPKPKWTQLSNRRLQNWGGIPHPNGMILEPIPQWLQDYVDKVGNLGLFEEGIRPNHVLINEYLSGQGIMPHFDGPLFHPTIATISCGSHTTLHLTKPKQSDSEGVAEDKQVISIILEPRSLLVLKDSMYHDYQHYIEEVHQDVITDAIINQINNTSKSLTRSTRISLTIRHVPKTTRVKIKLGR